MRFAATHFAGTQKLLHDENQRYVAVNPQWFQLHYRLGSSSGPVQGNCTGGALAFQPVSSVTLAPRSAALLLAQ